MKRKLFYGFIGLTFCSYWLATLFSVMPNNFIKLSHYRSHLLFDSFFRQRWSFFAPPPTSNDRLIYEYETNEGTVVVVEVLEDIYKNKTSKAPFNSNEDMMEYIIAGNVHSVSQFLAKHPDMVLAKSETLDTTTVKKIWSSVHNSSSVKTLINYAGIVAQKNNIAFDSVQMMISESKIQKFADRHKPDTINTKELKNYYTSKKFGKDEIIEFGI
ncbi:hypothetical protein ACFQ1M_14775 [Sungkyunkwania multivorans]|uniref:Uncharacterized protein n=1 Tax=Sungkyunkwania multivorans TaxID=1173618 RepID=A0ABW3D306_9FLAO